MRLSIKAKQVAGVTTIVGLAVVVLSGVYLSSLARVLLEESRGRGALLAGAIYQRARTVVDENAEGRDPEEALRSDSGLRTILESSAYDKRVTYAAIVDVEDTAITHSDPESVGHPMPSYESLGSLLEAGPIARIRAIYAAGGRTFELREPLLLRSEFEKSLQDAVIIMGVAMGGAVFVAMLLAQVVLRPIHVIRSGITRLGRG